MDETAIVEAKKPINIDISAGMIPHTYDELMQFSALYKGSGLAPKSFQTIQQVAIGIGMCIELRRPILTGLQDMAVINGKVSIYGDAALAQVRSSGLLEYIIEHETGTPYQDGWTFTCELKRKGSPEPRKGIWTWEDARRAGFDDPKTKDGRKDIWSPWTRFTRRMMTFKARNFPLRDEFGDVIKGMTLAEDTQDIIDVTPAEHKRTLKVDKATGEVKGEDIYAAEETTPPETTPEPVEIPTKPEADNVYACEQCEFIARSERGLKKHMTQSHPAVEESPPPFDPDPEPKVETPEPTQAEAVAAGIHGDKPIAEKITDIMNELGAGIGAQEYRKALHAENITPKAGGWSKATPLQQEAVLKRMNAAFDDTLTEGGE